MSKYQEALKRIEDLDYVDTNIDDIWEFFIDSRFYKDVALIKEVLDKETPMKPYNQPMTSSLGTDNDISRTTISELTCKKCDYAYLNDYINDFKYCAYCGQKLDWNDGH